MASVFKTLTSKDITNSRTLLHESIPVTGTIVSGTYNANGPEENIKNFAHGIFQSVYDYPYLSSSANHVFDITFGYSNNSALSASSNVQNAKKINIYNQMAQVLAGYDVNGSILEFDQDGDIIAGGAKHREVFFINLSRLLVKDEIKKGSLTLSLAIGGSVTGNLSSSTAITDTGNQNDFKVNSPAGEYSLLSIAAGELTGSNVGLVFYQAGIIVLTASIFAGTGSSAGIAPYITQQFAPGTTGSAFHTLATLMTGSDIQTLADAFRTRWGNLQLNNTTELNSTIYHLRINNDEFNYSSNPTYLNSSKIRVKNTTSDSPVSYITTIGLYSADNELLAVAKLSEPIKKTPASEFNLRTRLDF